MNFSSPIKYSGQFWFSPNDKYFSILKGTEIHIYDCKKLSFLRKFSFNDIIANIEWSPDSNLILVSFSGKSNICEVKSLDNPDWQCKIDEGVAGLASCRWSPDSRRVLTICEFNLRLTIWSLIDRTTNFINYPKYSDKGLVFTSNKFFMALAERKESKDYIGLYYVSDWTLVSHFVVESYDLNDICFSKDDGEIIIWDSPLECKFYVYSPTGNLIHKYQAYDLGLGIKSCLFSNNGRYLSLGYYDQSVRLFSQLTWKLVTELDHKAIINDDSVYIFKEDESETHTYTGELKKVTKYSLIENRPFKLSVVKPLDNKPNPLIGIGEISWSSDSQFFATKNDNIPNVVWIWQISNLSLYSIAVHNKPVKSFCWSPKELIISILTENNKVYLLSLSDASVCPITTEGSLTLNLNNFLWSSDGKKFLVGDKNNMFIGCPIFKDEQEGIENLNLGEGDDE